MSEINSWGGETKQYTAEVDPDDLRRFNLTLHDVVAAVSNNNANFGGSYIEHAEQQYTVRGLGRAESLDDLGNIVVSTAKWRSRTSAAGSKYSHRAPATAWCSDA